MTNSSALTDVINEFISTERSYVKRLRILKEVAMASLLPCSYFNKSDRPMRTLYEHLPKPKILPFFLFMIPRYYLEISMLLSQ